MENVVLFSGKHGDWSFSRQVRVPSDELPAFVSTLSSVVDQRGDFYVQSYFDVSELVSALDEVVRTRNDIDKAVSSAVRSRAPQSAVSNIVSSVSSEYALDKKHTAALKDVLKVFSVRYVISQKIGDFEHVIDMGEEIAPMGEGYFFVANAGDWVVVKKQRISDKTTPLDLIFFIASLSNTLHSRTKLLFGIPVPDSKPKPGRAQELAMELSSGGKDVVLYDAAFKHYMELAGFPAHYGVAYNRIRPPKRIRGVKTR